MASCVELLDALQHRAFHDPKVRRQLLATRQEKDPFGAFCRTCRELGYEIYEMDLICAGEEFHAAMKRSTNGGGKIPRCWRVKTIFTSCLWQVWSRNRSKRRR